MVGPLLGRNLVKTRLLIYLSTVTHSEGKGVHMGEHVLSTSPTRLSRLRKVGLVACPPVRNVCIGVESDSKVEKYTTHLD